MLFWNFVQPVPYPMHLKIELKKTWMSCYWRNTNNLFALLGGCEKFSKLDLSHKYQQLLLNPESCSYLTTNTHKGLFQLTHLQFDVNSASGIFQREKENSLKSVPFVKVWSDDILLSGKNDEEHLKTLDSVLKIILENKLNWNFKSVFSYNQKSCTLVIE